MAYNKQRNHCVSLHRDANNLLMKTYTLILFRIIKYFGNKSTPSSPIKHLNFNIHVTKLCKKASQKLHAVARVSNVMEDYYKCFHLISIYLLSSCAIVDCCIHKEIIFMTGHYTVYKVNTSSFKVLLEKSRSVKNSKCYFYSHKYQQGNVLAAKVIVSIMTHIDCFPKTTHSY